MLVMDPRDEPRRGDPAAPADAERDATLTYDPVDEARRVRAREAATSIPGLQGFALVVAGGPMRGAHWHLSEGTHEAGRNTEATVFLDDITVSRHHAAFRVRGSHLSLEDLSSTNGTYVNGKRAVAVELNPGDEVIIGRFHLVVARGA
ncbi:MAG: FHA domain-containing protein [Gemmatimonadetes bacterium]|nr:FHA domain-containing protein [Gemmatimonadota bacterium]